MGMSHCGLYILHLKHTHVHVYSSHGWDAPTVELGALHAPSHVLSQSHVLCLSKACIHSYPHGGVQHIFNLIMFLSRLATSFAVQIRYNDPFEYNFQGTKAGKSPDFLLARRVRAPWAIVLTISETAIRGCPSY